MLTKLGVDVKIEHYSGSTPTHNMVIIEVTETVPLFLSHDATAHVLNKAGIRSLDIDIKMGNKAIVDLLDDKLKKLIELRGDDGWSWAELHNRQFQPWYFEQP
ncbi:hypothetical protein MMC25_006671 [Agyrium rufum]|nr:hypothetical protein [Agyrium rufum]